MRGPARSSLLVALSAAWPVITTRLHAQELVARIAAQGVLVATRAAPVPGGDALAELRLVQPMVMLEASDRHRYLVLRAAADFEGLTMPNGELTPGNWGEGFVDRRHPHTYAHELMVSLPDLLRPLHAPVQLSLSGGKGFVPFGTDDPMSRPPVRFPVNHHLSQILERAVLLAGIRAGPTVIEAGLFNGDEPERPGQWPNMDRFGDSWAARLTVTPAAGVEAQVSHASVHSPEHRPGAGTDQRKWSASVRWAGSLAGRTVYALAEWARSSEAGGFFVFTSTLLEGAASLDRYRPYVRVERTERPEEERVSDFRSLRPQIDNSILGISRWTVCTAGSTIELSGPEAAVRVSPVLELSYARVGKVGGGIFDPAGYYGGTSVRSITLGLRLGRGFERHRMGRYGVAEAPEAPHLH